MSALPEDHDETDVTTTSPGAAAPPPTGRGNPLRWILDAFVGGPGFGDRPPERIGHYRIINMLGEGGMGRVYLAEDEVLGRQVALKVLKVRDRRSRKRFLREARAAARISHPHVCPLFEVGEERGFPYIVMDLLVGETLANRIGRGPLPAAEALEITLQVLGALETLHAADIVHRDVKPSNVFLTAHGVRLLDFGLARELDRSVTRELRSSSDTSRTGVIMGTPGYMAPEQILGHSVDPRADLFATASLLYEALTGRRPFEGDTAVRLLSAALYEDALPLTGSPALEMLDPVVRRGLSKRPKDRFASARDMAQALRTAAEALQGSRGATTTREVFVGRHAELSALQERLAAAMAGMGSVVFVTGERGVGKSSLVAEFLRKIRAGPGPITVTAGRCVEPQGPGEAFLPFLDAVGHLLAGPGGPRTTELLHTWAPTVAYSSGLLSDPDGSLKGQAVGATKERLIREAGDLLVAASRDFPLVLYLEDLQWADATSVELLHHYGCRLGRQRVLLLGTYRHAEVDASNPLFKRCALDLVARGVGREITLGALTSDDLQAYLDARFLTHHFPDALARTIHARTEGLALFARSLVDLLVERGEILRDEDLAWRLARPVEELDLEPTKGLQELVRHHVETLPEPERDLLRVASVCGREFLSSVVAALLEAEVVEVEERLRRLCDVRRLILDRGEEELPDGTLATRYRFSHGLYKTVLHQDLVASRRIQLHAGVADRLRQHWGDAAPRLAAEIAQHCEHGRDFAGAVTFRIHAADNAARRFAYAEAASHFDWATRLLDKLPENDRVGLKLALLGRRGAILHSQARFDEAAHDFRAMLAESRACGRIDDERMALASLCDTLFYARRVDEMAVRTGELLAVAGRTGRRDDLVEAQSRLGQVLACEGRFREAVPLLDDVVATAREAGPPVAFQTGLAFRGLIRYFQAEFEGAARDFVEGSEIAAGRGDGFNALVFQMFVGLSHVHVGRPSDGLRVFDEAIESARRNGDRFWLPRLVSQKGFVHRELLALDKAREYDAESLRLAQESGVEWAPEADALLNLCVDHVREGNVERAEILLTELQKKIAENDWLRWIDELRLRTAAAEHWGARGQWDRAAETAALLGDHARALGALHYVCSAERVRLTAALAEKRDLEGAVVRLKEAIDALRDRPVPFETWTAWGVLALAHRELGRDDLARAARDAAARDVRTIADNVHDEDLRRTFLESPRVREVLEAE